MKARTQLQQSVTMNSVPDGISSASSIIRHSHPYGLTLDRFAKLRERCHQERNGSCEASLDERVAGIQEETGGILSKRRRGESGGDLSSDP